MFTPGTLGSAIRSLFQDNFFSKLSTIRQQSPPESAYANSLKGMRIHRDGSVAHASGESPWLFGVEVMALTITNTAVA